MKLKCKILVGTFTTNLIAQNIDNVGLANIDAISLSIIKRGKEVYSYRFGYDNLMVSVFDNSTQYQIGFGTSTLY